MTSKETFELKSVSLSEVLDATLAAIDELGWDVTGGNSAGTLVTAKTKFSVWSSGERVRIELREVESGVGVDVRSSVGWQFSSWGRNADNIAKVRLAIERRLMLEEQTQGADAVQLPNPSATLFAEPTTAPARVGEQAPVATPQPRPVAFCQNCGTSLNVSGGRESQLTCSGCGEAIPKDAKFCPYCGVSNVCTSCGCRLRSTDAFCGKCGQKRSMAQSALQVAENARATTDS